MTLVDGNELWVSVDDFANEIIRWFLDVMDGHIIVITRGGEPFAHIVPAYAQLAASSSTSSAHTAEEAATGPSVATASEKEGNA